MLKNSKKLASWVIIFILMFNILTMYTTAAPRYKHTDEVRAMLTITNGIATCGAYAVGKPNTSSIVATVTLYRIVNNILVNEKTWSNITAYGDTLRWSDLRAVYRGYWYRLDVNATVYRNGESENVSVSHDFYSA